MCVFSYHVNCIDPWFLPDGFQSPLLLYWTECQYQSAHSSVFSYISPSISLTCSVCSLHLQPFEPKLKHLFDPAVKIVSTQSFIHFIRFPLLIQRLGSAEFDYWIDLLGCVYLIGWIKCSLVLICNRQMIFRMWWIFFTLGTVCMWNNPALKVSSLNLFVFVQWWIRFVTLSIT